MDTRCLPRSAPITRAERREQEVHDAPGDEALQRLRQDKARRQEALAESYHYQLCGLGIDSVIIEPTSYRSALSSNWEAPADPARGAEYGPAAEIIEKVVTDIARSISQGPSPQELADAVAEFIAMPPEERLLGVPIGTGAITLLTPINQVTAQVQTIVAERVGFTGLMKSSSRKAADG